MRLFDEPCDVLHRSVVGEHRAVVGDVVAAVAERALLKGEQPDAVDAEPLEVLELLIRPTKSPMPSSLPSWNARTDSS